MYRKAAQYVLPFPLNDYMYFSCSCKKSTKRSSHKGRCTSCSRNPSRPLVYPPAASPVTLEHLNLDPVQAENVPIFCLKFGAVNIGRAARAAAAAKCKAIRF